MSRLSEIIRPATPTIKEFLDRRQRKLAAKGDDDLNQSALGRYDVEVDILDDIYNIIGFLENGKSSNRMLLRTKGETLPPASYTCKLCLIKGHWLENCYYYKTSKVPLPNHVL